MSKKVRDLISEAVNKKEREPSKMMVYFNIFKSNISEEANVKIDVNPNGISGFIKTDVRASNLNLLTLLSIVQQQILNNSVNKTEESFNIVSNDLNEQEQPAEQPLSPEQPQQQEPTVDNLPQEQPQQIEPPKTTSSVVDEKLLNILKKLSEVPHLKDADNFILSIAKEGEKSAADPDIKGQVGIWLKSINDEVFYKSIRLGKSDMQQSPLTPNDIEKINTYIQEYING